MYLLKSGEWDGLVVERAKNLIHVVFSHRQPHGDVYAYVSKWLSETMRPGSPYVPHMVNLPMHNDDMREELGLGDKFVFGWYGGNNFNIAFARKAVAKAASERKDAAFVFMNSDPFCDLPNVLHLPMTVDPLEKVRFINTCDAMIHARNQGETFGLAIAEFSSRNKPVITYDFNKRIDVEPELCHLEILGDRGIYYRDGDHMLGVLKSISREDIQGRDWNMYKSFSPDVVMRQFDEVFLRRE
jgi:hypothetical protein